mgnify:CR=1 FL=1
MYHTLILKQGVYDEDDYDGQVLAGDRLVLTFPDICLTGEEKPRPGNLFQPGTEPISSS